MNDIYDRVDTWAKPKRAEEKKRYLDFSLDEYEYKGEHPLWEEIDTAVVHLMCEYGPDGHCDGHNFITGWILENYDVRSLRKTARNE